MKRLAVSLLWLWSALAHAQAIDAPTSIIPPGLNPGDEFYISFVTSTTLASDTISSAGIDANVNANADSSSVKGTNDPSIVWQGLYAHNDGTVKSISLFSANTSAPIYNLNGDRVATSVSDLFDGSIENPINYGPDGALGTSPFTVTGLDQSGAPNFPLGSGAGTTSGAALSYETNQFWISNGRICCVSNVYAVSPLLRVPLAANASAKAIPTSTPLNLLAIAGMLCLIGVRARRFQR